MSFFRHDCRSLKLRMICFRTRLVLMCKSSVYFHAPNFVWSGNGTIDKLSLSKQNLSQSVQGRRQLSEIEGAKLKTGGQSFDGKLLQYFKS